MSKEERFYKGRRAVDEVDITSSYILVDHHSFKSPSIISIENVGKSIEVKISEDALFGKVSSVQMSGQDINPQIPPDTLKVNTNSHIAIDTNYLYVWSEIAGRWKRIALSDWGI